MYSIRRSIEELYSYPYDNVFKALSKPGIPRSLNEVETEKFKHPIFTM
jgi:hypothetical protein